MEKFYDETFKYFSDKKRNCFYGSFESLKNLNQLKEFNFEATDVDSGLEYLTMSDIPSRTWIVKCSAYETDAKCSVIEKELLPFNYDVRAWQLANLDKMFVSRSELFTEENSKGRWNYFLNLKINQTQQKVQETKTNSPDESEKINKLEAKLADLKSIKKLLEELEIESGNSEDKIEELKRQLIERSQLLEEITENSQKAEIQIPLRDK